MSPNISNNINPINSPALSTGYQLIDVTATLNTLTKRTDRIDPICAPNWEKFGFHCREPCPEGWSSSTVEGSCYSQCPPGYADHGLICYRGVDIIGADTSNCPWYDLCCLTFYRGRSKCPDGYTNDGCTCRIDAHIPMKDSFIRKLVLQHCPEGYELVPIGVTETFEKYDGNKNGKEEHSVNLNIHRCINKD